MAQDLSIQERAIKAVKEVRECLILWLNGKITHESGMERINEILKKA